MNAMCGGSGRSRTSSATGPCYRIRGADMPEGHSLTRIARQFDRNFVGKTLSASSPQGRFAEGAAVLDGRAAVSVQAVGKQMFLETEGDLWLRVHLGLYGAWTSPVRSSSIRR